MLKLDRARATEGFMGEEVELPWLACAARGRGCIVEVGSWLGRSTIAMAENTKGKIYAVDTWKGSQEHQEELKGKSPDWLYDRFMANVRGLSVTPVRTTSVEAAKLLSHLRFNMVFLDASHDYESVKADILAWRPLLSAGGLLCGHDYQPSYVGVMDAVRELLPGHNLVGSNTSLWWAKVETPT